MAVIWGLRDSIIEPNSLKQLADDVRERWSEEYLKKQLERTKLNILLKYAENPIKVVRALQHAVISTAPRIRYRPGWPSKFVYFPLSMIPA
jgi:hypothetical protein